MKTFITILIILALIMFLTRPGIDKHKQAIAREVVKLTQQQPLDSTAIVCWDFEGNNAKWKEQAKKDPAAATQAAAEEIGKDLEVKNFWLCSVGSLNRQGKKQHVSLGMFGHVFCTGIK